MLTEHTTPLECQKYWRLFYFEWTKKFVYDFFAAAALDDVVIVVAQLKMIHNTFFFHPTISIWVINSIIKLALHFFR